MFSTKMTCYNHAARAKHVSKNWMILNRKRFNLCLAESTGRRISHAETKQFVKTIRFIMSCEKMANTHFSNRYLCSDTEFRSQLKMAFRFSKVRIPSAVSDKRLKSKITQNIDGADNIFPLRSGAFRINQYLIM